MAIITFPVSFRFGSKDIHETSFDLDLTDDQVLAIKAFIKDNPELPFWAMDHDCPEIFELFMDAHVKSIVNYVNSNLLTLGDEPFAEETIDWECVPITFDWPEELRNPR